MEVLGKDRSELVLPSLERGRDDRVATTLSEDTEFSGNLKFERALKIEGKFKGDLTSTGTLIVGKTGQVEAEIKVGAIIVEGKIAGNITAGELVDLRSTAQVHGDITAGKIKIEEGVVFVGRADIQPQSARSEARRPEPRPAAQPAPAGKEAKGS
ncbi:polymer-forming cytoskeletal protein [bacterium]|nr:polymer-forming cytoskeletal protein [bacterium]